jgi:hypothetical protein
MLRLLAIPSLAKGETKKVGGAARRRIMFFHQKIFAVITSIIIMAIVVELVRRRKLREEYSWLWLLTGAVIILLVIWYDFLIALSHFIGAVAPTTALFIFSFLFLMLISLHYSIQISKLSCQLKEMAQQLTLLRGEVEGKAKPEGNS